MKTKLVGLSAFALVGILATGCTSASANANAKPHPAVTFSLKLPSGVSYPSRPIKHGSTVETFNDGFATAKQDDCQRGFIPACTWLKEVNK